MINMLREAVQITTALPEIHKRELVRATASLNRLTVNDLSLLADALETHYAKAGAFQSATGTLAVAIMKALNVKVRVAEWEVVDGRCEHKRYTIGSTTRARHGEIGDETWLEAWIA